MKIFIYALPRDYSKIKHPFIPWIEEKLFENYFVNGLKTPYLIEKDGFKLMAQKAKELNVLEDDEELAKKVLKDKSVYIKTQNLGVVWNYPVLGFLINPYLYMINRKMPLPNGILFKLGAKGGLSRLKYREWFDYLEVDWRKFSLPRTPEKFDFCFDFILKSISYSCKMNLEMRKGNIKEPKMPKTELYPKRDKKVMSKLEVAGRTPASERKRLASNKTRRERVKKGECPLGDKCEYKKAGLVCLHTKDFEKLAKYFKTRDLGLILEGLAQILQKEAARYEKGLEIEKTKSVIDPLVTAIGQNLFQRTVEYLKVLKPELLPQSTYNILNQQVNIGIAVEKLEKAGLNESQRGSLANQVDKIIAEEKYRGVKGTKMDS